MHMRTSFHVCVKVVGFIIRRLNGFRHTRTHAHTHTHAHMHTHTHTTSIKSHILFYVNIEYEREIVECLLAVVGFVCRQCSCLLMYTCAHMLGAQQRGAITYTHIHTYIMYCICIGVHNCKHVRML